MGRVVFQSGASCLLKVERVVLVLELCGGKFVLITCLSCLPVVVVVVSVDPASQWRTGDPSLKNPREFS